ncbi:MAG: MarR family transcriptional regulator [Clostridiales bacterium 38-18]|nr:MAG: MarR family transcriptional regulator [Clostridiales bacterium 38-18]
MNYDALKLKNQLCFPLYAVSKEVTRLYKPFLDPLGLTYTQYITMMALWETDGINVKSLGERLFLDSGTLTPLLKKLEAQGLVKRTRSKDNERNVFITLTEAGWQLRESAIKVPEQLIKCLKIEADDAQVLYRILNKLLDQGIQTEVK